jgi:hypothetical protein
VCVWTGAKVLFEEMPRLLKILLGGSKMSGLLKIWMKGLSNKHRTRSKHNNRVLSNRKPSRQVDIFEIARDAGGSKIPGLLKIWMKELKRSGSNKHHTRPKHDNRVISNRKTLQACRYF